jgi:hypothetical protein
MKLTNSEIYNARQPLEKLTEIKLPIRVSYELAKLASKLNEQLQIIEKVRLGLIKTYGTPQEDNPSLYKVIPGSEGYSQFFNEFGVLMLQEVDIVFDRVELPDTLEIEPSILMALEKFITIK